MLDFTSALYLGLRHDSDALSPWTELTSGRPAVLDEPPGAGGVARALARRMGFRRGVLGPSTLHLFHDVFELLARRPVAVLLDAGLYPIGRWGAARAALAGAPMCEIGHHDPAALRTAIARCDPARCPVVVVDGYCPGCGRVAPLAAYLEAVHARDGWLVVDDTQALGVLGREPGRVPPFGAGGGGSLPYCGVAGRGVIAVCSLAKGFGVPAAVAAGDGELVARLSDAPTRVHCSPPSAPTIRAAMHALALDDREGDARRQRLAAVVARFRRGLARAGLRARGGAFPVQRLRPDGVSAAVLYRRLLSSGIRAVILRAACSAEPEVTLVLTARHRDDEIDTAVTVLARCAGLKPARESCIRSSRPSIE